MAKASHVQLGPGPANEMEQELIEDDASGSASNDFEIENAGVSTPQSNRHLVPEDGIMDSNAKKGWSSILPWPFRRGSTPSPSNINQALEPTEGAGTAEEEQTTNKSPHSEAEAPSLPAALTSRSRQDVTYPSLPAHTEELTQPITAPGNLATRKGAPRSTETYDVGPSPEKGEKRRANDEAILNKPVKRQRPNGKAKQPLTPPKRSKGKTNSSKPRVTKQFRNTAEPSHDEEEEDNVELQGSVESAFRTPKPSQEISNGVIELEVSNSQDEASTSYIPPHLPATEKFLVQIEGGDSALYMDPSPEKTRHDVRHTKPSGLNKNRKFEQPREKISLVDTDLSSQLTDDEEVIEEDVEGDGNITAVISASRPSNLSDSSHISIRELAEMYVISCRAGKVKKNKIWILVKRERSLHTDEGRRLDRRLERLLKYSTYLAAAKEERNRDKIRGAEAEIGSTIARIKIGVHNDIVSKLSSLVEEDSGKTKPDVELILRDVYFHTIPKFTKCIFKYADIYTIEESMETSPLREFAELVDIYHRLLFYTVELPRYYQPTSSSGEENYQTYQPGKLILSRLKKLRKGLQDEIATRDRAERVAEAERMRPQLEREQAEKELLQSHTRNQKSKERHRLQSATFQKYLQDPLLGHLVLSQILKDSEKMAPGQIPPQIARYVEITGSQQSQSLSEEVDDDDPFTSDDDVQIKINGSFGKNNNRENNRSQELSKAQKKTIIDTLRYNDGPDRYELVAKRTQLSMDEVFYYAKELQEVADKAHEVGNWNSEGDAWTYKIWIEQD